MTKVVEAIYSRGVLQPLENLDLPERQRVELTVRPIDGTAQAPPNVSPQMAPTAQELEAALDELFAEIDRMDLRLRVRMPTRDELYERS
jgi:predicted DNA-binding antitoxin AbrB/MazE fold protein